MHCFSIAKTVNGETFSKAMADADNRKGLLTRIKEQASGQCAVIAADNEILLCYFGENSETAEKILREEAGDSECVKYSGTEALLHLFSVVCGSGTPNESSISSAETAFSECKSWDVSGFDMNTILQAAVGFAKRLTSEPAEDYAAAAAVEADETLKKIAMHDFRPFTERVREGLSAMSLEALIKRFKEDMDAEQFSAVLESLKRICR